MIKKIGVNALSFAIGPLIPSVLSIAMLPIFTQHLTSVDYGISGIIMAYDSLLQGISFLGFEVLLMNSFFKNVKHWKLYWKRYIGILLIWQNVFVVIQFIILKLVMPTEAEENENLIIFLLIGPRYFFSQFNTIAMRYFQNAQLPKMILLATLTAGLAVIGCNYITIVIFKMGYLGWFISSALSVVIIFAFYFRTIFFTLKLFPVFHIKKTFLRKSLAISLPTIPSNYSAFLLNTSDRVLMERLNVPVEEIGKYNIAYLLGGYFDFFASAVTTATAPIYQKMYAKGTEEAEKVVKFMIEFLQKSYLTLGFLISLWCREVFMLLIKNDELKSGYGLGIIIIMSYTFKPMYSASVSKLFFIEATNKLWRISFLGGVINVILNIIFIPKYGIVAAAITTYFSLLYIGFAGFYLKDFRENNSLAYRPFRWLLIILTVSIAAYLVKDIDIYIKLVLTLLIGSGFVFYLRKCIPIFNLIKD